MTDAEYQYYIEWIADKVISDDTHLYRKAVRMGPQEFRDFYARYVERKLQEMRNETSDDPILQARHDSYKRSMQEGLEEINGTTLNK